MEKALRIGEVAGEAGVNVPTLRFDERRGLLAELPRRESGYRDYPPDVAEADAPAPPCPM